MKRFIIFLTALILSINGAQSQQLFAINDGIGFGKDGTIYIKNTSVLSWDAGLRLINTYLTKGYGLTDDALLLSKYQAYHESDPLSVKRFNNYFSDGEFTLEECQFIKSGHYFLSIADPRGGSPKFLYFPILDGKIAVTTDTAGNKNTSSTTCEEYIQKLKVLDAALSKKTADYNKLQALLKQKKFENIELNKQIEQSKSETTKKDEVQKELFDNTMPWANTAPVQEETPTSTVVTKDYFDVNEETERTQMKCPQPVIALPKEESEVVQESTNWPHAYIKFHGGVAFEESELQANEFGPQLTALTGVSAGVYITKSFGLGLGFDYSDYKRQSFLGEAPVPQGTVYALINQNLSGSATGLYGEMVYLWKQLSFTGFVGYDFLNLNESVREDLYQDGVLVKEGEVFDEFGLRRNDLFFGAGLDYSFANGIILGVRASFDIPGQARYNQDVPNAVRLNPNSVLNNHSQLEFRGLQLTLGFEF